MTETYSPLADFYNVREGLPPRGERGEKLLEAMRVAKTENPATETSLSSNEKVIFPNPDGVLTLAKSKNPK